MKKYNDYVDIRNFDVIETKKSLEPFKPKSFPGFLMYLRICKNIQ